MLTRSVFRSQVENLTSLDSIRRFNSTKFRVDRPDTEGRRIESSEVRCSTYERKTNRVNILLIVHHLNYKKFRYLNYDLTNWVHENCIFSKTLSAEGQPRWLNDRNTILYDISISGKVERELFRPLSSHFLKEDVWVSEVWLAF